MKINALSSIDQMRLLKGEINCITPFGIERYFIHRLSIGHSLSGFAETIIKKYQQFDEYGFDPAALVFLQNLYKEAENNHELRARVEQTLRLLILWNRRSEVKDRLICHHNVYLNSLKNEIELNLTYIKQLSLPQYNRLYKLFTVEAAEQNINVCHTILDSMAHTGQIPGSRELF